MRRATYAAIMAVLVPVVAGCGPEGSDFRRQAERLIESDNASRLPIDYKEASCEAPASVEAGATFSCSAVGVDGVSHLFITKITGARKFIVTPNATG